MIKQDDGHGDDHQADREADLAPAEPRIDALRDGARHSSVLGDAATRTRQQRPHAIRAGTSHSFVTALLRAGSAATRAGAETVTRLRYEMAIVVARDSTTATADGISAESSAMKVLVATDAWRPQVNGVVRTLGSLARAAEQARRRDRFSVAGRFLDLSGADLSGPAAWRCRAADGSPRASRRRGPMPSISPPKGRSALPCAPIAAGAAGHLRRATRRDFPNISRPARRSRKSGFMRHCDGSTPARR